MPLNLAFFIRLLLARNVRHRTKGLHFEHHAPFPLLREKAGYGGNFGCYRPRSRFGREALASEAMNEHLLQRAREAAADGAWQEAYGLLTEAHANTRLSGADLALLAEISYAAGHIDVAIEAWECAYAQSARAGNASAAAHAATRVAMHLLFDTALLAPVRGWIKRAERFLDDHETPVHSWLAVVRNYERLLSGDFAGSRYWARQAIELGSRHDPAVAAIGRIAEARSLILDGEVQQGLALLDEAGVAAVSGELDAFATGVVYCELICGLQGLAQYDRAEQWTQAMEHWRHGHGLGSIHGRCRVHRAEIFRLRGFSDAAEKEALLACDELRPYLKRELGWPLTELGRIRLQKGDLDGAEQAFLEAHQVGWDPQPGLAMIYLARGDIALAAGSIQNALEHPLQVPSKELPPNTELRRAPLLDAQVDIAIAAGDLGRAQRAATELEKVAAAFGSKALAARAAGARGRTHLAEGDAVGARRDLETAIQLWSEVGAPYELAVARVALAQTHRLAGNETQAVLEYRAARSSFESVGALQQAERAARDVDSPGAGDVTSGEPAPPMPSTAVAPSALAPNAQLFSREGEYWTVTFGGHTARLRDAKGLHYLARLLADPGREFHVFDLVASERGWTAELSDTAESELTFAALGDAGKMLDSQAKAAYRRRLVEIEDDIEEARANQDSEREEQADVEREFLVRELARAIGLGGRDRRAGSASERARASVTRAIRFAMARIRKHNPQLGEHFDRSVRTGTYCAYLPDPRVPVSWRR
jgi:tetratricopeptide (TPR) repeat protein